MGKNFVLLCSQKSVILTMTHHWGRPAYGHLTISRWISTANDKYNKFLF